MHGDSVTEIKESHDLVDRCCFRQEHVLQAIACLDVPSFFVKVKIIMSGMKPCSSHGCVKSNLLAINQPNHEQCNVRYLLRLLTRDQISCCSKILPAKFSEALLCFAVFEARHEHIRLSKLELIEQSSVTKTSIKQHNIDFYKSLRVYNQLINQLSELVLPAVKP